MYRFTYENQGSDRYLLYQLAEGEKLDTTALEMLNHNKIANILPVSFTRIDSSRFLRYSGLPQSTLKNLFGGVMSRNQILTAFESICAGIRSGEEYLLDGNAFVLEAGHIYVDRLSGKTSLVYLPILNQAEQTDYVGFFRNMITNLITNPTEDGSYITKILYYLNSTENFSLAEFSRVVKELGISKRGSQAVGIGQAAGSGSKQGAAPKIVPKPVPKSAMKPAPKSAAGAVPRPLGRQVSDKEQGQPEKVPSQGSKKSSQGLPGNSGKIEKPSVQPQKEEEPGYGFEIPGRMPVKKPLSVENENEAGGDKMSMMQLLRNFSGENLEKYKKQRQNSDQLNKKAEKSNGKAKTKGKASVLVLTSMDPQQPYRFEVKKFPYTIGRSENNDGVVLIQPVSRKHCKILQIGSEYFVEDTESKYGTELDGRKCRPGEKCGPLHDSSVLRLSGEIGFRIEIH